MFHVNIKNERGSVRGLGVTPRNSDLKVPGSNLAAAYAFIPNQYTNSDKVQFHYWHQSRAKSKLYNLATLSARTSPGEILAGQK